MNKPKNPYRSSPITYPYGWDVGGTSRSEASGRYDLVVLDEEGTNKIQHIIEVKRLKESEIHPEKANRHRGLEDIYVLTDFLGKGHKNHFERIKKDYKSYNLIFYL